MPTDVILLLALLALGAIIAALAIMFSRMPARTAEATAKDTGASLTIASTKHELGLGSWPNLMFGLIGGIWLLIVLSLTFGLLTTIWSIPGIAVEAGAGGTPERTLFRLTLITLATLTATLGGAVAVPLTLYRAELTRRQTDTAERAHFNEKINAATEGLHAMRQITRDGETIWEPDITRRNAAIDALYGLVRERPQEVERISNMLSVYVRELSKEVVPERPNLDKSLPLSSPTRVATVGIRRSKLEDQHRRDAALKEWATRLEPKRSDVERAVIALGRLNSIQGVSAKHLYLDLRYSNLQGMDLSGCDFTGADFSYAYVQGARFPIGSLKDAILTGIHEDGTYVPRAPLSYQDFAAEAAFETERE